MSEREIHVIRQGECISSLAYERGFLWSTIWDENRKLQSARDNPNALLPGDEVVIPEKQRKEESGATEMRHRFRKKGEPAKFRLIVERDDKPLANKPYTLEIDGTLYSGTTNHEGFLEVNIPPNARGGKLTIEDMEHEFRLGTLDPLTKTSACRPACKIWASTTANSTERSTTK